MTDFLSIRKQFPQAKGYLDSASTSLTAPVVIDEMTRYYKEYRANVHRGMYKESECATREYELARKKVAAFIGANPDEIIFTPGATLSSNMLYRMLEESGLAENGNVVTTALDHHAQFVPLQELARRKTLEFRVAGKSADVVGLIDTNTRIIGVPLASNVTGEIVDVAQIAKGKKGALLVVDATAAIGHIPVDVSTLGADALYFSGHKMLGPTGVGVLWVKGELLSKLRPSIYGGHMVSKVTQEKSEWSDIPSRFEAGTLNIAGVIGLGKAVEYMTMLVVEKIHAHIQDLLIDAQTKLSAIEGVTLYSDPPEKNVGNIAFTVLGIHPHDVAEILARHEVKVRAGHHCAMPLHTALGVSSTVRASFHCYNSKEDVDALIHALKDAISIFSKK